MKEPLPLGTSMKKCPFEIVLSDEFDQIAPGDIKFNKKMILYNDLEYHFRNEREFLCLEKIMPSDLQTAQRAALIPEISIKFSSNIFLNESNTLSKELEEKLEVNFTIRKCQIGEYFSADNMECLSCEPNFFSFTENFLEPSSCKTCSQENFFCYGGFNVTPKSGYWRRSYKSTNFIKCTIESGMI